MDTNNGGEQEKDLKGPEGTELASVAPAPEGTELAEGDPESLMVIPREQFNQLKEKLIQFRDERNMLLQGLGAAVDLALMMNELFGGDIPKEPMAMAMRIPKIIKNLKKDTDFVERAGERITLLKAVGIKFLPAEVIAQLQIPAENE